MIAICPPGHTLLCSLELALHGEHPDEIQESRHCPDGTYLLFDPPTFEPLGPVVMDPPPRPDPIDLLAADIRHRMKLTPNLLQPGGPTT